MNVLETGQLEHMAFWLFTNAPGLLLDLTRPAQWMQVPKEEGLLPEAQTGPRLELRDV